MTTDFRALCAELLAWAEKTSSNYYKQADVLLRARAALAEQPVMPTDEELLRVAAISIEPYESSGIATGEYEPETECAVEVYGSELIAYARAVLTRWGNPAPQPVPVSERLPGPEDCDAYERCWFWTPCISCWEFRSKNRQQVHDTHWLSAYALPLPEQEVSK